MIVPRESEAMFTSYAHLVSADGMKAIMWVGFSLCLIGLCSRTYIRIVCFRHLVVEDYIMAFALFLVLGYSISTQMFVQYVYMMLDVGTGTPPPPTIMGDMVKGFRYILVANLLSYIGIYAVKFSFLVFFHRLGGELSKYVLMWRVVTGTTALFFIATVALQEYKCTLSSVAWIARECTKKDFIAYSRGKTIALVTMNAFSDVLILCLPISILWKVDAISLRKKVVLGSVFSLTLFTIAVSIVRGVVQNVQGRSGSKPPNPTWNLFWGAIELFTAFVVACLVSFRMLFVHNGRERASDCNNDRRNLPRSNQQPQKRGLHDTLLDTFKDREGTTQKDPSPLHNNFPLGRMSVDLDFANDEILTGQRNGSSMTTLEDRPGSGTELVTKVESPKTQV